MAKKKEKDIFEDMPRSATKKGWALVKSLGLEKLKFIWVQKIYNLASTVLYVSFDSRFPSRYFPVAKLRNLKHIKLKKLKVGKNYKYTQGKFSLSPPVQLKSYSGTLNSGTLLIVNDIAGEYRAQFSLYKGLYESYLQTKLMII